MNYTDEQKKDIEERTNKVIACMAENQLGIALQALAVNNGNDTFSFKADPYFSDLKFNTHTTPEAAPETTVEAEVVETTPETNETPIEA